MVAMPVLPPRSEQSAIPSASTTRGINSNLMTDPGKAPKDTESIQMSSNYVDATSISSSHKEDSQHDNKASATNLFSQCYDPTPINDRTESNDSPKMALQFSPDGPIRMLADPMLNCYETPIALNIPGYSDFNAGQLDNLGPLYDEIPDQQSIMNYVNPLVSNLSAENFSRTVSNVSDYLELDSDQRNDPESISKRSNEPESTSNRQYCDLPMMDKSCSSRSMSKSHPPESNVLIALQDTEPSLQNLDSIESTLDLEKNSLSVLSQIVRLESAPGISNCQVPISPMLNHSKLISVGEQESEVTSAKNAHVELSSEMLLRPGSLSSQRGSSGEEQQRHFRREVKLHNLLSRSLQTRAHAYELRCQLRQARNELSIADESFMKLVRERRFPNSQDDLVLEASYRRLQVARDIYGPLEEAYNLIEEQLNNNEFAAKELEEKILKLDSPALDFDYNSQSSTASEYDLEASEIVRETQHPLYDAYLSRLGDADLCREKLAEKLIEHDNLLHAQDMRRKIGVQMSLDNLAALEKYPAAEEKLETQLRLIEEDVERLRQECVQEGLFAQSENECEDEPHVQEDGEEIDLSQTLINSRDPELPEYKKYPLLLERPEEKEDEDKSKVLLTDFKEGDVGDRIACWLLHKLRLSGLEVELLARFTDGTDPTASSEKWQEEVLEFWFFDSTNLPPSAYQAKPTQSAIPPSPPYSRALSPSMGPERGSLKGFGDIYHIQAVVRSSALSRKLDFDLLLRLSRLNCGSALTI